MGQTRAGLRQPIVHLRRDGRVDADRRRASDRLFTILLVAAVAATLPVNRLVRRLARSHRAPAGDAAALAHQQPNPAGTAVEGPGGKLPR
ncbi:hypothetical protein ACFV4P_01100 [Kitasatospora sp. NPDC059795]|uniref:hypothetical protein n=1 Tax=Kitasatospora sp. NPDC059795 TaxID=3346949 RepID=UPI00365C5C9B